MAVFRAEVRPWMRGSYLVHPTCDSAGELSRLYHRAFGWETDGRFVEFGAYDGLSFSTTWGLAVMGWAGLYVEPNPPAAEACKRNHAPRADRVAVEEVAVGGEEGRRTLYTAGPHSSLLLGGLNAEYDTSEEYHVEVDVTTPDALLERRGCGEGFELLVVDVEGMEREVLSAFTLSRWRPKLAIIETFEKAKRPLDPTTLDFVRSYFDAEGYEHVHGDVLNSAFMRAGVRA